MPKLPAFGISSDIQLTLSARITHFDDFLDRLIAAFQNGISGCTRIKADRLA
jgi:hypothetical protein